jgi:hypothetical protein
MPGPPKITLAQAKAQGSFMLVFYCVRPAICSHSGEMRLDAAIARWGGALRLDQVPARCTRCGSRDHVDVRARPPMRSGWGSRGPLVES